MKAQITPKSQVYTIVHITPVSKYSKQDLNKEIARTTEKSQVLALLSKKIDIRNTFIQFRILKTKGRYSWWTIDQRQNKDREGDYILMQTKDTQVPKIYSTTELKRLLKDTLVVVDTFELSIILRDEIFSNDQYYVNSECKNEFTTKRLPGKGNTIFISKDIYPLCKENYLQIALHHTASPEKFLGECTLFFMTEDIKKMLSEIASDLKALDNSLSFKSIVNYVGEYVTKNYGKVFLDDISRLLSSNTDLNRHP